MQKTEAVHDKWQSAGNPATSGRSCFLAKRLKGVYAIRLGRVRSFVVKISGSNIWRIV